MNMLACRMILLSTILVLTAGTVAANETIITTDSDQPVAATLTFAAEPLKSMTEIPFTLACNNKNILIHSAVCELTMPAMKMPENHPKLTCTDHNCTGKAVFTMGGVWQSTCGLIMKDGSHTSIVFDIGMVKMK